MKLLQKALVLLIMVFLVGSLAACGGTESTLQKIKDSKTLVVGTDSTFPPFEFKNDKKEYTGFDIDLIRAVAKEMGANKVQFVDTEFNGLIPGLQAKKFDLIVSAMYKTPKREETIQFSDTYYPGGLAIMIKKGDNSIKSIQDLYGKKVALQIGTKSVDLLKQKYPQIKRVEVEKNVEMFLQLESGRVDAVITGKPAAKYYTKQKGTTAVLDQTLTTEEYCYGIRKEDTELQKAVNEALNKVKQKGEYQKITQKWFGE